MRTIWAVRRPVQWEWFSEDIIEIEKAQRTGSCPIQLDLSIFLTGKNEVVRHPLSCTAIFLLLLCHNRSTLKAPVPSLQTCALRQSQDGAGAQGVIRLQCTIYYLNC